MKKRIGILGSCITKDILKSMFNNFDEKYQIVFSNEKLSLISIMGKKIPFEDKDIEILPHNPDNDYKSSLINDDLNKTFLKNMELGIDYLFIDLYFEALFGVVKYDNTFLTNNYLDYPHTQFYKKIKNNTVISMLNFPEEFLVLWKTYCDNFFKYIEKNYPNTKIILNKVCLTDTFVNNDTSYIDSSFTVENETLTQSISCLEKYIEDNYDIDIISNNAASGENHIIDKQSVPNAKEYSTELNNQDLEKTNEKFNFSIIIPYKNSENYLRDAIESVINQSLDFEKHVQMLLINDQSTDKSEEIAIEYYNKYPQNILLLTNNSSGISNARNLGIKKSSGKYINFLDSDDYLSENVLKDILAKFNEYYRDIDVIAIPITYFNYETGNHELNNTFQENFEIINLNENPNVLQTSISSTFIKRELFNNLLFNVQLISSEDILLLYKILLKRKSLGFLNTGTYYYRKRFDWGNESNVLIYNKKYYADRLKNFHKELIDYCKFKCNNVPLFVQNMLLYDLINIIKLDDLFIYENDVEKEEFFDLLHEILTNIDDNLINNNDFLTDVKLKSFILYLKYDDLTIEILKRYGTVLIKTGNNRIANLKNHRIWIENIQIGNHKLIFEGFFYSLFNKNDLSIQANKVGLDNKTEVYYSNSSFKPKRKSTYYLSKEWYQMYEFIIEIPLNDNEEFDIELSVEFNNDLSNEKMILYPNINFKNQNKIFGKDNKHIQESFCVHYENNKFHVSKAFNFTVIMAVYNAEQYLDTSISSIINQTLDFKDNIELILIDDGSLDNSLNILNDFQKEYPENIRVISQTNQGQAAARNNGLKYARGKYINFLDADDYLSENVFEKVFDFFERYYYQIDIVSIPIVTFDRIESEHILNNKIKKDMVIDLEKNPNNPQLSASSSCFKSSALHNEYFSTAICSSEDSLLINKILLETKKYGVVKDIVYYYRKRFANDSTIDTVSSSKDYFTDRIKNYFLELIDYSLLKEKEVPLFIQYVIVYDLQFLVSQPDLDLMNHIEQEEFFFYLKKLLNYIDVNVIVDNEYFYNRTVKDFFLRLKNDDLHNVPIENDVLLKSKNNQMDRLSSHRLYIDIVELKENYILISGIFNSYFSIEDISIKAIKYIGSKTQVLNCDYVKYNSRSNVKYLGIDWQFRHNFTTKVPFDKKEMCQIQINVIYHKNHNKQDLSESNIISVNLKTNFHNTSKLNDKFNYIYNESHVLLFKNDMFYLMPNSTTTHLKCEKSILNTLKDDSKNYKIIFYRLLYLLLNKFYIKKEIWLFNDRLDHAEDNALHLYKYAINQKDNIKKYFIISKDSPDYKVLKKNYNNIISHGSFKHKLLYLFSDKIISSFLNESFQTPFFSEDNYHDYNNLVKFDKYFLQHGVISCDLSKHIKIYKDNLKLILTSADMEKNSFKLYDYGYSEETVQALGLPRYDNLKHLEKKKFVLFIPSWRSYLDNNDDLLINSDYFKSIVSLMENEKFKELLDKTGYKFVFKPHPELVKYVSLFENESVLIDMDSSFQKLFGESSILITDFSSVFFDFAYLKKPIIYYQPNDDYHYEKGYFDYETMGFGKVIMDEEELIDLIGEYIENNCEMEHEYQNRVDSFFKYHDQNNCKRVYDWIKKN